MNPSLVVAAVAFVCVCFHVPSTAFAQSLQLSGSIGGSALAVQTQGSIAYLGEGVHLTIVDVSTPASPVPLGRLRLPDFVRDITLNGTTAYVVAEEAGLFVVDVSVPASPTLIGSLDTPGFALSVDVLGTLAVVADFDGGVHTIDITTPAMPILLDTVVTPGRAFGVALAPGGRAYIADDGGGLVLVSISDPMNIGITSALALPGMAFDVAVSGTTVYVASGSAGLHEVNYTDSVNPVLLGSVDTPGSAFHVRIDATRAWIADLSGGVQIVDITTPGSPVIAGSFATVDPAFDVSPIGTNAFVANEKLGLQVLDASAPASISTLGSYEPPTFAQELAVAAGVAYVADELKGVKILDVSTPASPALLSRFQPTQLARDLEIDGTDLYIAASTQGMLIVDVTVPAAPAQTGIFIVPSAVRGVERSGGTTYVAVNGLFILDNTPAIIGTAPTPGTPADTFVVGTTVYIADQEGGLQIVDASTPSLPVLLGGVDTPGTARRVVVSGSLAYVADVTGGVRIIDVSAPALPFLRAAITTAGDAYDVALDGNVLYVADGPAGVQVIDVTNPQSPTLVQTIDTPGTAMAVEVVGTNVYVADQEGGLIVFSSIPIIRAPQILDPGDVIIGDLELATMAATMAATMSATGTDNFVFPDAFDLRDLSVDLDTPDSNIKWSFFGGAGRILINGVGPLAAVMTGPDDPLNPGPGRRIELNDLDPDQLDADPFTVTFRNANLSPIGGPNVDPGPPGIVAAETTNVTLFASDMTTFTMRTITVFTSNETSDSLSNGGFVPIDAIDFTDPPGSIGWTGVVISGAGATTQNVNGLCMGVPLLGDNLVAWISPERFVELIDNSVYRISFDVSTDQMNKNAIPLFTFLFDNFNSGGGGNNFGGEYWFWDGQGGAQGIGRAQGRTRFTVFFAPTSISTPQWRGTIDPANSAFSAAADAFNDMRLAFRVLDFSSNGLFSSEDAGTICVSGLTIDRIDLDDLVTDAIVYNAPINTGLYAPQASNQAASPGSAVIDDAASEALYQLDSISDRKTLFPFDISAPTTNLSLWPIQWEADKLYRARIKIRSNVDLDGLGPGNGTTEGTDPVEAISLNWDTASNELGQIMFMTRGTPSSMFMATSPRLPATTGGTTATYTSLFYSQNLTASPVTDADGFRPIVDFFNNTALFGNNGADALAVEEIVVERILLP